MSDEKKAPKPTESQIHVGAREQEVARKTMKMPATLTDFPDPAARVSLLRLTMEMYLSHNRYLIECYDRAVMDNMKGAHPLLDMDAEEVDRVRELVTRNELQVSYIRDEIDRVLGLPRPAGELHAIDGNGKDDPPSTS